MSSFLRNPHRLEQSEFDVLVIGGGINGVGIAWDAALRGLSVALIDKSDFGGETSAACFKIVHGGLRYLQQLDFRRVFESAREQQSLRRMAPHLIRPLPFTVPCYGYGKKSRGYLGLGLNLYELLTPWRNDGVLDSAILPEHYWLTRDELLRDAPGLETKGLSGGQVFHDAQMEHCERLTLAVAQSAVEAGAVVCNYVELLSAQRAVSGSQEKIERVIARDALSGDELTIRAKFVISAAGTWAGEVESRLVGSAHETNPWFVRGVQLVMDQIVAGRSLAIESKTTEQASVLRRGGRAYFLVPWQGATLCGTFEAPASGEPEQFQITDEDIDTFLSELRTAYRSDMFDRRCVRSAFGGLIPLEGKPAADGRYRVCREDRIVDWNESSSAKVQNVLSVRGTKYTTFRALAERVVDRLVGRLGTRAGKCSTANRQVVGGKFESLAKLEKELDFGPFKNCSAAKRKQLVACYGQRVSALSQFAAAELSRIEVIDQPTGLTRAEIEFSIREEMAVRLADILKRRTSFFALGRPNRERVKRISEVAEKALGWSASHAAHEIDDLLGQIL